MSDKDERKKYAEDFVSRHHNQWTRVKFLGVWDTVDALGLPLKKINTFIDWMPMFRHKFHNLSLSKSVENARQALAIDDERFIFHPKIWEKEILDYQTLKQVWFCGMHTDVGGGYKEQELSDIPLIWMVEEAKNVGLRIYPKHEVETNPKADGFMHNSREGFPSNLYVRKIRTWNTETHGKPVVHESVLLRKLNKQNTNSPQYHPWILDMDYEVEPWPEDQRNANHPE
jgi:uncharacterized protein (DUF2235 family)